MEDEGESLLALSHVVNISVTHEQLKDIFEVEGSLFTVNFERLLLRVLKNRVTEFQVMRKILKTFDLRVFQFFLKVFNVEISAFDSKVALIQSELILREDENEYSHVRRRIGRTDAKVVLYRVGEDVATQAFDRNAVHDALVEQIQGVDIAEEVAEAEVWPVHRVCTKFVVIVRPLADVLEVRL